MDRNLRKQIPSGTDVDDFTPPPPPPPASSSLFSIREMFKPPPNATSFDDFTPLPPVPLQPPPPPSDKPTKFARPMNLPPYIGGVQSAPKGATPPLTDGIFDKLSSSMDGMMIPILIGGGILLIILIS